MPISQMASVMVTEYKLVSDQYKLPHSLEVAGHMRANGSLHNCAQTIKDSSPHAVADATSLMR